MQTSQRKAPKGDFRHPHYLQNWFNEVLCICQEFLWHGCLETHIVSKVISKLWFLITILTNNVGFSVMIIWLWQKPKVYTMSRNSSESITPQDLSLSIVISSIHIHFYVGFKHAISQFNPIFPAFGVLQWNRFHLILNIWPTLPLETLQPCVPPTPKKLLKANLLCPTANHCQLASMNNIIDNQEAGQQIKCQVWLETWCLIICL